MGSIRKNVNDISDTSKENIIDKTKKICYLGKHSIEVRINNLEAGVYQE